MLGQLAALSSPRGAFQAASPPPGAPLALTRAGRPRGGSCRRREASTTARQGPPAGSRWASSPGLDGRRGTRLGAHKPKRPSPRHKYFTKGPEGVHGTQITSAEEEENEDLFPVTGQLGGNAAGPGQRRTGRGAVYATAAPSAGNGRKLRVRSGWRVQAKNGDRVCDPPRCPAPSGRSSRPRACRGRPGPGHAHHHVCAAASTRGTLETKSSVSSAGHRRHVRMYSFASLVRAPSTQFILQDQPRT